MPAVTISAKVYSSVLSFSKFQTIIMFLSESTSQYSRMPAALRLLYSIDKAITINKIKCNQKMQKVINAMMIDMYNVIINKNLLYMFLEI